MKLKRVELADMFSVSETTLRNWFNEGMPRESDGRTYDTRTCINWFADREVGKLVTDSDGAVYDPNAEKGRLTHHQANVEAMKEAQLRKELISADDVLGEWSKAVLAMRAKMLSLSGKLAKTAISAESIEEIERNAESMIHEALSELSIYE